MGKFTDRATKIMRTRGQYRYSKVLLGRTPAIEDDVVSVPSNDSDNWSVISKGEVSEDEAGTKHDTSPSDTAPFRSDTSKKWTLVDDLDGYEDESASETSSDLEFDDVNSAEQDRELEFRSLSQAPRNVGCVDNHVSNIKYAGASHFEEGAVLEPDIKAKGNEIIEKERMRNHEARHATCAEVRKCGTIIKRIDDEETQIETAAVNVRRERNRVHHPKHWLIIEKYAQLHFKESEALPTSTASIVPPKYMLSKTAAKGKDGFKGAMPNNRHIVDDTKNSSMTSHSGVRKAVPKNNSSYIRHAKPSVTGIVDPFSEIYQNALRRL